MQKKESALGKIKIYEIGYLLVPTIPEEGAPGEAQNIKNLLESKGAAFITEDQPKMRLLAYDMVQVIGSEHRKYDKAYFGWVKFEAETTAIPNIRTELEKNNQILRFIIIETVRENTMVNQKVVFRPSTPGEKEKTEEEPKMTEEEMDKTIANLVVE
jgi:ribosomal protein S6